MRSSTVAPEPGSKLARTRHALAPRRRSTLAGWIWLSRSGPRAVSRPDEAISRIALSGCVPGAKAGAAAKSAWRGTWPIIDPFVRSFDW